MATLGLPWACWVVQTLRVRNAVGNWSISLVVMDMAGPDDVNIVFDHEALECVTTSGAVGAGTIPRSVSRNKDLEGSPVRKKCCWVNYDDGLYLPME